MPTISGRTLLAAGASVANVLLGSQYELAPFDGTIEIGVAAALQAFAVNTIPVPPVDCGVFAGSDVLQEPGGAVPGYALEQMPRYPDDYHWEDEVAMGDRLKLTLHNGNAAGVVVNWAVRITPA